jgi:DNA-binding response OmpR family regulator
MNLKDIQDSTILLVDDNPEAMAPLGEYLKLRGFSVCSVEDGTQVLEIARRHQPDIILLDVLMPGMTGFDICRQLKMRDDTKDIPVVFMSALSETVDKITGFDVGGWIILPNLLNMKRSWLGSQPTSGFEIFKKASRKTMPGSSRKSTNGC